MANLNTDKIREKNIYYKQGAAKDKSPVFYLIARRYTTNDPEVEMDALLYYILKVMLLSSPLLSYPILPLPSSSSSLLFFSLYENPTSQTDHILYLLSIYLSIVLSIFLQFLLN